MDAMEGGGEMDAMSAALCEECGEHKVGEPDETGVFYCMECWDAFEEADDEDLGGFAQGPLPPKRKGTGSAITFGSVESRPAYLPYRCCLRALRHELVLLLFVCARRCPG